MKKELDDFLIYLSAEKGLSSNSVDAYKRDILHLIQFLERQATIQWSQVTQDHIIEFLSLKKKQDYSPSSIHRNLIAIKVLFRFLKREMVLSKNEAQLLDAPKLWQIIPDILTSKELDLLLSLPDQDSFIGSRDKAILEMLYGTGIRVSELCSIRISEVDDQAVRVIGKGRKERIVPVGKMASEAIDQYLKYRDSQYAGQEILFLKKNGKPMSRLNVWKIIKKYTSKAGIKKKISPHSFRHTFACHLLDNGADLRVIQDLLGHSNIISTDRYTQISRSHVQKMFDTVSERIHL